MKGKLTPRSYHLYVHGGRTLPLALAVMVSALLAGAGGYVFFYTWHPAFLILLLFAIGIWPPVLSTPYRIDVRADQVIEIVSLLRRKRIVPADIRAISNDRRGFVINTRYGPVNLWSTQFTDFHLLLTELRGANPEIEFLGC